MNPENVEDRVRRLEEWKIRSEKGDWKDSPFTQGLLDDFKDWGQKVETLWNERQINEKVEITIEKREDKSGKIELSRWQLRLAQLGAIGGLIAIFRNAIEALLKVFFNG